MTGQRGRPAVDKKAQDAWLKVRPRTRIAELARYLSVKPAAVSKWRHVPEDRVDAVANFLGVAREVLRPDLYPPDPWAQLSNSKGTK